MAKTAKLAAPKNRIASLAEANGRPTPVMEAVAPTSADIFSKYVVSADWMLNPDLIAGKESAGLGIEIYDEMEDKDAHLYGLMQVRKSSVSNLPWKVLPYSEEAKDVAIAAFCEDVLKNIRKFNEDLYELLDGIAKGFAVSEVMYSPRPDGFWGVYELEARRQRRFQFSPGGELKLQTKKSIAPGEPVPPRKFLILRHGAKAENPYGDGVLKHCYWQYFIKKNGLKFWAVFLERFGQPAIDVKTLQAASPDEINKMQEIVAAWQQSTAITHGENIEVQILESAKSGGTNYETFMEFLNKEQSKAILGQASVTDPGRPGTQASPEISNFVRRDLILQDAATLADVIESQLLRWLVDFNFGYDAPAPRFTLEAEPEEDLEKAIARDEKLFLMGLPIAREYFYNKYKIPAPKEGADLMEAPEPEIVQPETMEPERPKKEMDNPETMRALAYKKPAQGKKVKRYDIASMVRGRRRFVDELNFFFRSMEEPMKQALSGNRPVQSALEDFIADQFPQRLAAIVKRGNLDALRTASFSMAKRLGVTFNENRFTALTAEYARRHAYELGAAQEMTKTIREIMSNYAADLVDSGATLAEIRDELLATFNDLSKSRAEMIAVTETQNAANWAATKMARESGLDLQAYFVGESTDEPLCLDLLSGNPYPLDAAEVGVIPHPNCQHNWVFALKEENA